MAYFSSTLAPASSSFFFSSSLGGSLNGSLGLGQAQTGDLTDSLNDLDLLGADLGQHHVELGLLFSSGSGSTAGGGSSHSGGGDAELLLQSVDELGELQNSQTLNLFDEGIDFLRSHDR